MSLAITPRPAAANLAIDLDAIDLEAVAEAHDTPFYVYDLGVIERRVGTLRAAMPDGFDVAYAVKANPNPAVLARLAKLGLGTDIASGGELERVLAAGIDPGRVVFTGPGKRDDELVAAVAAGIGLITVESPGELRRLASIAGSAGRPVPILLRRSIDPGGSVPLEANRIIGDLGVGKFGMDDDDLRGAARAALDSPWIELRGIHSFGASNVLDATALVRHAEQTMAFGRVLAAELGFPLLTIDVGGGLGIPYADGEPPLDLLALRDGFSGLRRRWAIDSVTAKTRVLVEPGRFLVGPAGVYVARVVDTKRIRGRAVAVLDGGINHLLRPTLVGQPQRIRHCGSGTMLGDRESVTIAGPLCTGLDVLAYDASIGLPAVGELLAVVDAGAYGYTESMPFFLSRPLPAEVVLESLSRRGPGSRSE